MKIVNANAAPEMLKAMRERAVEVGSKITAVAEEILRDVRTRGFDAVREYSLKFDKAEPREISREEMETALVRISPILRRAIERSAENIREYQQKILSVSEEWEIADNCVLGQVVRGMDKVGIYVPGGTAAYPSTVLMNAIPAQVAGVREIIMVTPPTENMNDAVLAAAFIAGVDRVIGVGGVQAVAALSYGAGFIPRVDKLTGPGNAYVAAAKRMVYGNIDIDMVAGPSEVLIIADETANYQYVAADLLSQAEHDRLAACILLTTSESLAGLVADEVKKQSEKLLRKDIIEESINNFGAIIVCENLDEAAELANEIAPEHLEVMTAHPRDLLPKLKNAGAIFLGENTPEPLGDYMAGPSHVLPTSGTARFFSPLSCQSFLKRMSVIEYSRDGLEKVAEEIVAFAESEKLDAHANSIKIRFGGME